MAHIKTELARITTEMETQHRFIFQQSNAEVSLSLGLAPDADATLTAERWTKTMRNTGEEERFGQAYCYS